MKNRLTGVILGQIILLVIVCTVSTFIALTSFGGIAGVAIASDPEAMFKYTAPLTCPNGTVDFQEYHTTYNEPGENNFFVDCVTADGNRNDVTLPAIGYSLLGFYLACFLPLCIPGGILAFIVPLFFLRGKREQPGSQPPSAIGSL